MISIIVAHDLNRGIGYQGNLPWKIREDLAHFKRVTNGSTMIMGRKTFDSLPGVLPRRKHIVLTRDLSGLNRADVVPDVIFVDNIDALIKEYKYSKEEVFVIGGAEIYESFMPHAQKVYVTEIYDSFLVDTYFPAYDKSGYKSVTIEKGMSCLEEMLDYYFLTYSSKR